MAANAATTTPTPFGSAVFNGYASGDEVHLGAVTLGTTQLADVEQAFSGATTNSAGLASVFTDPTGPPTGISPPAVIQPAEPASVKAYGMGSGLEVGLANSTTAGTDLNQILLSGKAQSIAPPNSPAVTKQITIPSSLSPLISGAALIGRSSALYDPNVCPLGQPLSYGLGSASNVTLLPTQALSVQTAGSTAAQTANTTSFTYLNANPDGNFGLASQATETIAPVTVNTPLGALRVTVSGSQAGATSANPVTLKVVSNGDGTSSVSLTNDNTLTVTLTPPAVAGIQPPTVTLVPATALAGLTAPQTITLPLLGTITINTLNQFQNGNVATANYTLFGLNLNLAGALPLANLEVGHLIAGANAQSEITCTIPIVKFSTPPSITAGNSFIYTIEVPDPAKLDLLACSLQNLSVVDTISDVPGGTRPTFSVTKVDPVTGVVSQTSPTMATVTFNGLTYTVAPVGAKPNPPLVLSITVAVPAGSPTGTLQDTAVASAVASGCNGGITGVTNLGGVNGTHLSGGVTLKAPTVRAAAVTPAVASQPAAGASGQPGALPRTGGQGGLWQPGLGIGLLALAGGAFGLLRRSRRRLSGS
ncbi:MAG: LPXTG cell wall anchor domain-containing protein [Actinomycetota bacterium]|nr:LPXTG cell wall anchor domain-containing protein [Actinomycetota bacterium]